MIKYILDFMNEIGFDIDAIASLQADMEKICSNSEARALFEECAALYAENIDRDYKELTAKADKAAELAEIHRYSAELLMFIVLTKHLRKLYKQRGIDDRIWLESVSDLKWKALECKAVKGIWGSFVDVWYYRFFDMTRFALGRLQFEMAILPEDCVLKGAPIKAGEKAISIHIPRTLTPLTKESRLDAYRQAVEVFKDEFGGKDVVFACHSWLLSSEIAPMLREGSNLKDFILDFEIVKYEYNAPGEHPDAWRLFDMDFTGNIDDYPENTSFRRAYKTHIKNGGLTGCGLGLFFAKDVLGE